MPGRAGAMLGGAGTRAAALGVWIALALCVGGPWATAQAIGFTVQVIAVSDQANAVDISRGLMREGFPAYVVRSTGVHGDVYRVRVGAFANRAAAVRYAAAMPGVGGSRPVPALAEAIPFGIMPLAPRVLWQGPVEAGDLRVLPWPSGVALRRQSFDPLVQATYELVQGGEVRTVEAWRVAPLAELPAAVTLMDVPFVDLTQVAPEAPPAIEPEVAPVTPPVAEPEEVPVVPPDAGVEEAPEAPPAIEPEVAPEAPPAVEPEVAPVAEPDAEPEEEPDAEDEHEAGAVPDPAEADGPQSDPPAAGSGGEEGEAGADAEPPVVPPGPPAERPVWADAGPEADPEEGLLLLRNRSLWPPTWDDEDEEVRSAYREATLALVAIRVGLDRAAVEERAYLPGGAPPPALVVVEVSDRSGRDLGDVRGLGDPAAGLRPEGPAPVEGVDTVWWPPADLGLRVPLDAPAAAAIGGGDWTLTADRGFVRIETADGANWRAVAGELLWSDGRYALVRDGPDVVLVDFVPR